MPAKDLREIIGTTLPPKVDARTDKLPPGIRAAKEGLLATVARVEAIDAALAARAACECTAKLGKQRDDATRSKKEVRRSRAIRGNQQRVCAAQKNTM